MRAGGRITFLYAATGGFTASLLPCHPCLALAQDCAGEALTPFLSRRIITMVKVAPYDFSKVAEYRAAGEAAARSSGTLDVGLRERMGEAYDVWLTSRRKELPTLVHRLVRGKVSGGDGGGSAEHGALLPGEVAATSELGGDVASGNEQQAPVSRGQLKKDAKRLIRQMQREQRLAAAAAAGGGASAPVEAGARSHDTADLERFAAAVGWKRGGPRAGSNAGLGSADGGDDGKGLVAASQSKRARLRQNAAHRVALMMSGELPMQIGQVPFMRPSVLVALGGVHVDARTEAGVLLAAAHTLAPVDAVAVDARPAFESAVAGHLPGE